MIDNMRPDLGTTTPARAGGATSFRLLSSHSNMNTPPIINPRRSQDDGDEGAIAGIQYPSSSGQHQSMRQAAAFDETFHLAMVSSKRHHSAVILSSVTSGQ